MPLRKELVITGAAVAAAAALVGGVAAVSNATTASTVTAGYSGYGPAQGQGSGGPGGGHEHTAVTGSELTKVTAAVKAKDSAITVTSVQKDPDGSYDVHGTKAGAPVMVEVSKDLKTIEVRTGGPGGRDPGTSTPPAPSATSSSTSTTT